MLHKLIQLCEGAPLVLFISKVRLQEHNEATGLVHGPSSDMAGIGVVQGTLRGPLTVAHQLGGVQVMAATASVGL